MQRSTPPYASEVILYRTRTDILSDLRFIADGTTYPLVKIQSARVKMLWYYLPLQLLRVIALLVAVVILGSVVGLINVEALPGSGPISLIWIAVLVALALPVSRQLPTHVIRLNLGSEQASVIYSSDRQYLTTLAAKINEAAAKVRA